MRPLYRNRSFLRLFLGRLTTNAGDSMYGVAAMWLVWELSGSSFYTGIAGFLFFSAQPVQMLAGPLVDRWSLRKVLVGSQVVQLIGVLLVPIAAATGHLSVWLVLFLLPVVEFLNQFVYPAQLAALPRVVEEDQLVRANSLFSFAYQGANMVFNALAGVLIGLLGAVAVYVIDAITFLVTIVIFAGLRVPDASKDDDTADEESDDVVGRYMAELREGFGYLRGSIVMAILFGSVVINFAYGMVMAVLPAFADTVGGPEAYGMLTAAMGAGSLVGAAGANVVEELPLGWTSIGARFISAACFFGAVAVPGLWFTVGLFFAAYVPTGATNVMSSSMLQNAVDDTLLGRVVSVRNSVSTLAMPVGSLLGGAAATRLGSGAVIAGMGVASVFYAVYFFVLPGLRSLPPVVETDEEALGLRRASDPSD